MVATTGAVFLFYGSNVWLVGGLSLFAVVLCVGSTAVPGGASAGGQATTLRALAWAPALLAIGLAVYAPALAGLFFAVLGVAIFAALVWRVGSQPKLLPIRPALVLALFGVALGVYVLSAEIDGGYLFPAVPTWLRLGLASQDVYGQAALTESILRIGYPSFGIGDTSLARYHFGSNYLYAGLAAIFGAPAADVSIMAGQIVVAPLFFAVYLRIFMARLGVWAGAIFFAAVIVLTDRYGWNSQWLSDSYLLALVFLGGVLVLADDMIDGSGTARAKQVAWAAALCALALVAKLSVGLMAFGLIGYLLLRREGPLSGALWAWAGVTLAAFFVARQYLTLEGHSGGLKPIYFFSLYGFWPTVTPLLPLLALLIGAVALALLSPIVPGARQRRGWPGLHAEAAAVVAGMGGLIANVLEIPGGSGYYFADIGRWVGAWALAYWLSRVGALQCLASAWAGGLRFLDTALAASRFDRGWVWRGVSALKAVGPRQVAAACAMALLIDSAVGAAKDLRKRGRVIAQAVAAETEQGFRAQGAQDGYGGLLVDRLIKAEKGAAPEARLAVYAENDNPFWRWPESCQRNQVYFIQGMTGLPLLSVPQGGTCDFTLLDILRLAEPGAYNVAPQDACARAADADFDTVLTLTGQGVDPNVEVVPCGNLGASSGLQGG